MKEIAIIDTTVIENAIKSIINNNPMGINHPSVKHMKGILSSSITITDLPDLLSEVSQLIAGWNATEKEWSEWDQQVKEKVYQMQLKLERICNK